MYALKSAIFFCSLLSFFFSSLLSCCYIVANFLSFSPLFGKLASYCSDSNLLDTIINARPGSLWISGKGKRFNLIFKYVMARFGLFLFCYFFYHFFNHICVVPYCSP